MPIEILDFTSKSIIDKADVALIGGLVPDEQLPDIAPYIQKFGMPTQVQDIYKVRRGKWTNLKIWSQVDLGTCRRRDLFVTDANFKEIYMESLEYNFDDNYGVYNAFVHHLNGIEVDPNTGEVLEQEEKYAEEPIPADENAGLLDVHGNLIGQGKVESAPAVESSVFGGLL